MKSTSKQTYRIVDLFAGAGGLSCGFLQTGRFEIAAAFENNPHAQSTYRNNHPNAIIYNDVSDALTADIGQVDVVIGGPPCQGFSNANRQKNHAISQNNSLVKKYVQAVLHLKPMAFIMENVSMLQSKTHRFYVDAYDSATIEKYAIETERSNIPLLDDDFMFEGITDIVDDADMIKKYLWCNENDYLALNAVYKYRNNPKKIAASLKKHKNRLLDFSKRLIGNQVVNDHVFKEEKSAGKAILEYFSEQNTQDTISLCKAIEPTIMLQRMFSKVMELYDNQIIISEFSRENGLIAVATSMAIIDYIEAILKAPDNGYIIDKGVLSAADFGVPQKRLRYVVMGVRKTISESVHLPTGTLDEEKYITVHDAISDIENVDTFIDVSDDENGVELDSIAQSLSSLGMSLRDTDILYNHVSTNTTPKALERFKKIKQGDNFHSLDAGLKTNYSDPTRTQNTIYLRLKYDEPSGTVVNVRKSMWIHPVLNRALSIREAARLQTFPDSFVFSGTKDAQYQQVGNAVPPILAKAIAEHLCGYLGDA